MKHWSKPLMVLVLILSGSLAWAQLSASVEELVDFETKGNAAGTRSNEAVETLNYEIPLRLLESDIDFDRLSKKVLKALVFERKGEKFVRWVINPEDTKWHLELEAWMKQNGVSTAKKKYFEGYMTASRSYIVRDPASGLAFSLKVSTNNTGGAWRDKKQTWDDARQVKISADHAMQAMKMRTPENFLFMDEPLVFGVKSIDQGMLLRLLADLSDTNRIYVPGFSALHEEEGRHIAKLNGSDNPAEFWKENYMKPLARAIAELAAMTGLSYDSPHSQNFLVELDANFKPTGKIVFRDLGDSYLVVQMAKAMKRTRLLESWDPDNKKTYMQIAQGVLHGNQKPSWVSEGVYDDYGRTFFVEFEKEFARITKIPVAELFADGSYSRSGNYFMKGYAPQSKPGWNDFFRRLERDGGLRPVPMACGRVMML